MANYTTIDDPTAFFQCEIWTGNGSNRSITLSGNSDLQPDMVWLKQRSGSENHNLYDSIRGAGKRIIPNLANSESTTNELTAFNSDGFSLADGDEVNKSSSTYVSWNWKAGTAFSNDASSTGIGSIDSVGSFNNTCGFSVVSWTGTEANATVKHGLSSAPKVIFIKCRDTDSRSWVVYHDSIGNTKHLTLNETDAEADSDASFNDTSPTTSVFSLGSSNNANASGTMIAFCFAEKQGYSKFGSYTGNGDNDGTYVHLGFKPAFVMTKSSATTSNWEIKDNKRLGYNTVDTYIKANAGAAEDTGVASHAMDFLSNGFKHRGNNDEVNASGEAYIYMAFAENPFVTSGGVAGLAE